MQKLCLCACLLNSIHNIERYKTCRLLYIKIDCVGTVSIVFSFGFISRLIVIARIALHDRSCAVALVVLIAWHLIIVGRAHQYRLDLLPLAWEPHTVREIEGGHSQHD